MCRECRQLFAVMVSDDGVADRSGHRLAVAGNQLHETGLLGRQDVHAQAHTQLRHAFMVIIKTRYTTVIGTTRTSYGCGYAGNSKAQAERAAVYDLRNYSWGWKPEFGYEVMEAVRY